MSRADHPSYNAGWGNDHPVPFQWLHWHETGWPLIFYLSVGLSGLHRYAAHLARRDR